MMTTSSLHLELLLGGQVSARSTARSSSRRIPLHEAPTPHEANVMNPFARRPLGVPLTSVDRAGILVIFTGIALVFAAVLVG